jgi:tRNA threonylcarbamoyladenosine modification (KEOPS) complex Cgi121 subunit
LLFEIKDSAEFVWISAFDTKPDSVEHVLQSIQAKYPDVCIQLVDLDRVAGSRYLFLATYNALKSFRSTQPIARSLGMEILLFAAGNRQIGAALKNVGVSPETRRVAAIAVGKPRAQILESAAALRDIIKKEESDDLLDRWDQNRIKRVRSVFGIEDNEIKALCHKNESSVKVLERLAIERSAMLAIRK